MSLEGDIRTALLDMSAVTALVGTGSSARIRPYKFEESDDTTREHILIEIDTEGRENDLTGRAGLGTGLVLSSVNISCRAMTRTLANALAEAVRINGETPGTGLAGYGGSGTAFHSWLEDETPSILPFGDKSDREWHTVEMSFTMQYTETV